MKKLFIAVLLTVTLATSTSAADETKISSKIKESFKSDYAGADNVTWSMKPNYVRASFQLNGKPADVYYDLNGDLIGTSQKITLEALPVHAKRTFAKKYADYTVKEAIRFEGVEETAFFISAENDKHSVILKVTNGGINTFKKSNKK